MQLLKAFSPTQIIGDLKSLNTKQSLFLISMLLVMSLLSVYWQDSMVSLVAGLTGVTCVFLVNMRKLSNFSWGLVNAILYGYVAYSANYYGDTMLNWIFYVPVQLIGAYFWVSSLTDNGDMTSKKITSVTTLGFGMIATFLVVLVYSYVLSLLGGSLSTVDATTTTLSILATILMVKGYREQWVCWIIVNILSIFMWVVNFMNEGTGYGVLIMWVMFLINSVYGAYTWYQTTSNTEEK